MRDQNLLYSRYFSYIKPFIKLPIVRNYGSTIFTLFVTAMLIFFAIKPTVETILVLQKKLAQAEEVLQKVTEKANSLSLGKKNYDDLNQAVKEKITAAIPDTVSLRSAIQTLEQIASIHDASISALQFQPLVVSTKDENQIGTLTEISFVFNTEGNYNNLIALLQDLNLSSRLISTDSLSLSKASEGNALIMSLSGKAYYLK